MLFFTYKIVFLVECVCQNKLVIKRQKFQRDIPKLICGSLASLLFFSNSVGVWTKIGQIVSNYFIVDQLSQKRKVFLSSIVFSSALSSLANKRSIVFSQFGFTFMKSRSTTEISLLIFSHEKYTHTNSYISNPFKDFFSSARGSVRGSVKQCWVGNLRKLGFSPSPKNFPPTVTP